MFLYISIHPGVTSTTEEIGSTTESSEILSTSAKILEQDEKDEHITTIFHTSDEITTTQAPNSMDELLTTSLSSVDEKDDPNVKSNLYVPAIAIETSKYEQDDTIKSTNKSTDRSRVVSKEDIESIRGRSLNWTNSDRKGAMTSGVIYVTAPPQSTVSSSAKAVSKSLKAFNDDLSDVSMDNDNDNTDFQSSEIVAKTSTTIASVPSIHGPMCKSKVRIEHSITLEILKISLVAILGTIYS